MKRITLKAPAKINLILDIVGKRKDGYHELRSVMQTVSLYDYITLTLTEEIYENDEPEISVSCDKPEIPTDKRNTVCKACEAFFKASGAKFKSNIQIDIQKNIPSGAGLAGGSSDGAAVLVGLNRLFGDKLSQKKLCETGSLIGADVPFCIVGGTALCEGIGEKLTPLKKLPECSILLVKPDISISTPLSYKKFDELDKTKLSDFQSFVSALENENLSAISRLLSNSLEETTDEKVIYDIKETMTRSEALGAVMTGSGSCVFGIFENKKSAEQCEEKLRKFTFTKICSPENSGVQIFNKGLPVI